MQHLRFRVRCFLVLLPRNNNKKTQHRSFFVFSKAPKKGRVVRFCLIGSKLMNRRGVCDHIHIWPATELVTLISGAHIETVSLIHANSHFTKNCTYSLHIVQTDVDLNCLTVTKLKVHECVSYVKSKHADEWDVFPL